MSSHPRAFARARRRVRRLLSSALPERIVESAYAVYLGRWWLRRVNDSEEPDLIVARALLGRGDIAVDGGANFGRYSDAFAEAVGSAGRVLAVEPIPRTARLLRRVLRHRRHHNVEVVQVALAAAPGKGRMEVPFNPTGDANFFRAHLTEESADGGIQVVLETLDRLVAGLPRPPALVKLDLEGHERAALAGAASLLRRGSAWLLEMNDDPDDPGSDAYAIESTMATFGYTAWVYDAPARALKGRRPGPRGPNVFFLLPAHLARVHASDVRLLTDEVPAQP